MNKRKILTLVLAGIMLVMPCFNTTSMASSPEENYWNMDKNNTELVADCRMIQVADNMSVFMCTLSSNPRVTQNMTSDFSEPLKNVTMEVSVEKPSTKIRNVFIEAKDESGNKDVSNVFLSNNLSGYKIKEIDYASKHLKFTVDKFGKASSKCILPFVNSKDELDYNNDRISYLTIYYNDELKEETKYHITLKAGNTVIIDEDRVAPIVQLSIPEKSQVIKAVETTYGNPKDTIPGTIEAKVEDPYNLKEIKQKPVEGISNAPTENTEETPTENTEEVENNEDENTEKSNEDELTSTETKEVNEEKENKEETISNEKTEEKKTDENKLESTNEKNNNSSTIIYIILGICALGAMIFLIISSRKKNSK